MSDRNQRFQAHLAAFIIVSQTGSPIAWKPWKQLALGGNRAVISVNPPL